MTTTPTVSSSPARTWRTVLVGTPLGWAVTLALAPLVAPEPVEGGGGNGVSIE